MSDPAESTPSEHTFARLALEDLAGELAQEPTSIEDLNALLPPGQYIVEKLLGQGGMGAVYKGIQVRLGRPVAIKIMRRNRGADDPAVARFEREARAMARLNHPNIVTIHDVGEAGTDFLYIAMEYVAGSDVASLIAGG